MSKSSQTPRTAILMGNEAIGRGLVEQGVHFVSSYPGTPSSEILPSVVQFAPELDPPPYCEWSVNEKVATEMAIAATYTGKRAAVAMKQVGLNVALDPVMSAAYIGVKGGLIIISADDPGPHSSQTEQDSRLLAHFAKLPVLDPDSPAMARDLIGPAFELSEKFEIPVILRPTLRVCHGRQNLDLHTPKVVDRPANFKKDPMRWAAIPKARLALHHKLNRKLDKIAQYGLEAGFWWWRCGTKPGAKVPLGILASGLTAALARDCLAELGWPQGVCPLPFLQTAMPFPLATEPVRELLEHCERVLVLEETEPVLEMLAPQRERLWGRYSGHVPNAGEITPEVMLEILERAFGQQGIKPPKAKAKVISVPDQAPPRRPNLCPGCPHRTVFWAMRRGFPDGIFPGDIGCYTLGLNQGAVDTCHDMGAAVTMGAALAKAHQMSGSGRPVVAAIGDGTFYASGTTGLINAVYNGHKFVLVILDNSTIGMTGMQPTPESGATADGHPGRQVDLIKLIQGCGVPEVTEVDAYDGPAVVKALQAAWRKAKKTDGSVQVVVARHACISHRLDLARPTKVEVDICCRERKKAPLFQPEEHACADCGRCIEICPRQAITRLEKGKLVIDPKLCTDCRICVEICPTGTLHRKVTRSCTACGVCGEQFSCPALVPDEAGFISIDHGWCIDCGQCLNVCAHGAIREVKHG